ncbi:histidine-containing phosphotransfer protein [Spatholobus suberectus]|nr:histidine-containing phosphotransfer protein [Spatholobus suberectus]
MERLKMQLSDTFQSMKQETYSRVARHLWFLNDQTLNCNLMKEYVYKVEGNTSIQVNVRTVVLLFGNPILCSSIGACGMALAFIDFERTIDATFKEECLKALNRAQCEYSALEEKLHVCLQF